MAKLWKRWGKVILISLGMIAIYLFSRLINLTQLPIFTDEAIYIRWSQIGSRDANWRFISLVDGKQPLFTWIMMVYLKLIHLDPLFVGRLVSVTAGFFTLVGVWFLAYELFKSRKIATLTSFLYLISPFGLMYDRMALYDSLVGAFYVWNFYLAILLARYIRLDVALILGLTLGAGMLNKSSGFLSLYLLPTTILLFPWKQPERGKRLCKWLALIGLAAILSELVYSVLRLSPLFNMVSQKDAIFVYPFWEWLTHPFRFVIGNLRGLFDWLIHYLTIPIFFVSLLPLLVIWRKTTTKLLLYIWWLAPFVALALFGRVLYPRFILFMSLPLLVLVSSALIWFWGRFKNKILPVGIIALILIPCLYTDYFIDFNILHAPIPNADRGQYLDNWPAGWGVKEVNQFLAQQIKKGKTTVYTDGTFGLLPYAIEIYLVDNPNLKIIGIWPLPDQMPEEMVNDANHEPTYLVLNQTPEVPLKWQVRLLAEYPKGLQLDRTLRLFQVLPTPVTKL